MCIEHSLGVAWFLAASPMFLRYPKTNETGASDWSRFNCLNASVLSYWGKRSVLMRKWQCLELWGTNWINTE